jgi:hypothetical protein
MPLTIDALENQASAAQEQATALLKDGKVSADARLVALAITQVGAEIAQAILQTNIAPSAGAPLSTDPFAGFGEEAPPD